MSGLDVLMLFFLLGVAAGLLRSDLTLPKGLYDTLTIYLLLAIGLKGGVEMARQPLGMMLPQMGLVMTLGVILPLLAYPILRFLGRFAIADAASIAAHYGSVSVGTFAVAVAFLESAGIAFESYMPVFVVVLEMPAIAVGIMIARKGMGGPIPVGRLLHEVFLSKGMVLLGGGLLIGFFAGPDGVKSIQPFYGDLFKGMLALFLVDMGLVASRRVKALRQCGVFLISFAVLMPLASSLFGVALGQFMGLSVGGIALLATLAASASYIAVPAAMRLAVPEANPTYSITAALGVTFPFNVIFGIPLYLQFAERFAGI
ncbi:sodium-dependent bicarbonate transport family permease [Aliiglaciecola sp. CAU 1673]|uniref:sodium-dependent bicarbonate transport family permease n=1 Tax=Aliiglaciecola sp. CAU 1673 TaxID=3032595 RepID=UPI0023DB9BC7|nr:sodium-dependent bicarbonate transport family permease [Aliiglaciecola sp. CAU 1673]MDF2177882.1 sodium-dependent bicarbonate transport family permease [Aliiglaciecola sp. CAU 1673]